MCLLNKYFLNPYYLSSVKDSEESDAVSAFIELTETPLIPSDSLYQL